MYNRLSKAATLLSEHTLEGEGCDTCMMTIFMHGLLCMDYEPCALDRMAATKMLCPKGESIFINAKIDFLAAQGMPDVIVQIGRKIADRRMQQTQAPELAPDKVTP